MAGKRDLSIVAALGWAFGTECARFDFDDAPRTKASTEYMLMQRAKLGGIRVDGGGRSLPHDDAQDLAWMVQRLPLEDAATVAEYARAGMMPDWMPGAEPRLVPRHWNTKGRFGLFGKSEVIATYVETSLVPHPKNPAKKIERKRKIQVEWVPCTWDPHPQEVSSARAAYQRWWVALEFIRDEAQAKGLRSIIITDQMPPFQPWA